MRRLRRHPDGELPADPVEAGDAAACLDGSNVNPRNIDVLGDHHVGAINGTLGRVAIAGFPVPDVVGLLVFVRSNKWSIRLERLERIDHRLERLVLHLHGGDPVGRPVTRLGHHHGDFLRLIDDVVRRQHHLRVAHQRGHPRQSGCLQLLASDNRRHAGHLQRFRGIDAGDVRVCIRAAHDVHVQHARQLDIVDVLA